MWEVEEQCSIEEFDEWVNIFQIEAKEQKQQASKGNKGKRSIRR